MQNQLEYRDGDAPLINYERIIHGKKFGLLPSAHGRNHDIAVLVPEQMTTRDLTCLNDVLHKELSAEGLTDKNGRISDADALIAKLKERDMIVLDMIWSMCCWDV